MEIANIISGLIVVAVVMIITYPLACFVTGADEVIKKCNEIKKWAEDELAKRGERDG